MSLAFMVGDERVAFEKAAQRAKKTARNFILIVVVLEKLYL